MRRSIRLRLIVWVLALFVPMSAAAGWLLIQVFGNRLLHEIDLELQEEAETVGELMATPAGPNAASDLVARIAREGDHGPIKYVTVTRDGHLILEAPDGAAAVLRSDDWALRIVHSSSPDPSIAVSIGVSTAAALHAKQRLASLLTAGIPLMLVLYGGGLWLVIGRALRPLEQASRRLDDISAETLSVRIPVDNPDDEVGRMVTVLNRMLERLEHAVLELRRFTADAAHELRTPLTVLRTGLEVALARERSAAEYRAALTEALVGTDRMSRLAEDLLTLARLEAAGAPDTTVTVDVSEVLHELTDAARELATQRGLTVTLNVSSGLYVSGSATALYRLVSNLIDNAIRYSGDKGQIMVAARPRDGCVEISVSDTGPGIEPGELSRVFDRFYRGESARADGGTGLGLSIAQEIARTHGGWITAANREGRGCVFTVRLRMAAATTEGDA